MRLPQRTGALGLPLYAFRYLWEAAERVGYMADEVRAVAPWAVFRAGPFEAVDYAALRAVARSGREDIRCS